MKRTWNHMAPGLLVCGAAATLAISLVAATAPAKEHVVARVQSEEAPQAAAPSEARGAAWLGVYLQEIDADLASALDLRDQRGALVRQVEDGSPAAKAGVAKGDVIVGVDGRPVRAPGDVIRAVRGLDPGRSVRLDVVRKGKEQSITAHLTPRPSGFGLEPGFPPEAVEAPDAPVAPLPLDPGDLGAGHMDLFRTRAYLGVRLETLNDDLAKYFGARSKGGVLVTSVEEESPAGKAGVRGGDVILSVDGQKVSDPDDVVSAVREKDPGDQVTLVIWRERRQRTVTVEAGKADLMGMGPRFMVRPRGRHEMRREMYRRAPQIGQALREQMERLEDQVEALRNEVERLKEKAD